MHFSHPFLKACRGERTSYTPIWLMRQAGRYMASYRALKQKYSFWEMTHDPKICAEVTLQPVRAFEVDAAIIFADIMTPLEALDVHYQILPQKGPVIQTPIDDLKKLQMLSHFHPHPTLDYFFEAIEKVVRDLDGHVPLIGFSGAPFTLAMYLIQGQSSRNFEHAKKIMHDEPTLWHGIMRRLVDMIEAYVSLQVKAGVQAIQIFDSWIGLLSQSDYQTKVLPHMRDLFDSLKSLKVPIIHFGTGQSHLLSQMARAGGDVMGIDWRIPLDEARRILGEDKPIQGNLDPTVLLAKPKVIKEHVERILNEVEGRPGHIFNLGHGILKQTPEEHVDFLIKEVHRQSRLS